MQVKHSLWVLLVLSLGIAQTNGSSRSGVESIAVFEDLSSSDISIQSIRTDWTTSANEWKGTLSYFHNRSSIQYSPSNKDLIGTPTKRSEHEDRISINFGNDTSKKFNYLYSLGYYNGYSNYRSIWLDEFYRQQFEPVEGYSFATPYGYSASIGTRIEYIPTTARLELNAGYQFDEISPAYEAAPFEPLKQGISKIDTYFASLSSENIINERLKLKYQLRLSKSTARALRANYGIRAHFAVSESWVLKANAGNTQESSDFNSKNWGLAIERDFSNGFLVGLLGRHYSDSGEISDPSILSTAAPDLSTDLYALNLSWSGERLGLNILIGRYDSDYGQIPEISFQFENLYGDREWDAIRLSGNYSF